MANTVAAAAGRRGPDAGSKRVQSKIMSMNRDPADGAESEQQRCRRSDRDNDRGSFERAIVRSTKLLSHQNSYRITVQSSLRFFGQLARAELMFC